MCWFIRIKGKDGAMTGYFVPRLYRLSHRMALKMFGFSYILMVIKGWRIWWCENESVYLTAKKTLNELKKTRLFTYEVLKIES